MRDDREYQGPEYWDTLAGNWEQEIFNTLANDRQGVIRGELERVADGTARVADFGCGVGLYLPLLSRLFGTVHGFEQSRACVQRCRGLSRGLDNVTLHNTGTAPRRFRGHFDVVLCVNVALHPQRWYGVMRSAVSLLKDGGWLIAVVPALDSARLVARVEFGDATPQPGEGPDATRPGVVLIDGIPTKHFRAGELRGALSTCGAPLRRLRPVEYEWHSYGLKPAAQWRATLPWDWLLVSRKKTADA